MRETQLVSGPACRSWWPKPSNLSISSSLSNTYREHRLRYSRKPAHPVTVPVRLLPRYQRNPSYALSAHALVRSKMNHEITSPQNSPCLSNRDSSGDGLRSRPGQPISNPVFRSTDADVLLPLRARSRREAMQEDVRLAAI